MKFLVIDVGTSDCRAAVVSNNGKILSQSRCPVSLDQPRPTFAEIDCDEIWTLVQKVILSEVHKHSDPTFDCIGISAMLGYVFLDNSGQPLMPAITYADNRAAPEAEYIRRLIPDDMFIAATGRRSSPMLLAPKMKWLARHRTDTIKKLSHVIGLKDEIVRRLTGNIGTDLTHLDYSGFFNINTRRLDGDILDALGIDPGLFAAPAEATAMAGTLSAGAAGTLSLTCGVPVIVGSSDGTTAMYGAGILDEGRAVLVSGTTDVLMTCSAAPPTNPGRELCVNSGMLPDSYLVGGPLGLSGGSLQYFERLLQAKATQLESEIRDLPPGSDGLLLFPGLTGERSPYWQAHLSGALIGLIPDHRAEHILRAVMEGCALRISKLLKILAINNLHPRSLNTVGGGSRNDVWNQIRADASGLVVQKMSVAEATCLGTALFCQAALDQSRTLRDIAKDWIKTAKRFKPVSEHTMAYKRVSRLFENFLELNTEFYRRLNEVKY